MGEQDPLPTADGYRGIWYACHAVEGEYAYKYSGGLGTYCAKHIPLAWHAPQAGKTFFVYGGRASNDNRLLHMVSYFDHRTGTVPRPRVLVDKGTGDAHDNPTILLDAAGHVWVFSAAHGVERPAFLWRSVEPHDITRFERTWETNFSYPQAWPVGEEGILFCHTRYEQGRRMLYWMTSPDGLAWDAPKPLARILNGHYQISNRRGGRVATAFNMHPERGLDHRTNLYYLQSDDFGATWRTAAGQAVQTPLTDVDNPALVRDFQAEGFRVYLKDLNFDAAGRPVVLVVTSRLWRPGPESGPRTWTTLQFDGGEWVVRGQITSDSNYDTGCLHVEPDGAWRIIGPTEPGPQPFNPGGEMAMWTSRDEGAAWTKVRRITSGSEFNHSYARRPVDAHPGFYGFWADGHGRRPSPSRLYFCNSAGQAFRLPAEMKHDRAEPQALPG